MKENKLKIIINKPVEEVFAFTTNPQNTPLWVPSIMEETAEEYPPRINTKYKNRSRQSDWTYYKVVEFKENEIFTLADLENNYHVRYSYRALDNARTEMEYFEWVRDGELEEPFTNDILEKLKSVMENGK